MRHLLKAKAILITFLVASAGLILTVSSSAQTVDVSIVDFAFVPADLTIELGTTVRWTNNDAVPHTTTSNGDTWDSGNMVPGGTFSFTFSSVGEYPYVCTIHPSMTGTITVESLTSVEDDNAGATPKSFDVSQNYPNPFNPVTNIPYSLSSRTRVTIEVFNVAGQRVSTLLDREQSAGQHMVTWDGTNTNGGQVPSGVYMYRIATDLGSETRKMVLIK